MTHPPSLSIGGRGIAESDTADRPSRLAFVMSVFHVCTSEQAEGLSRQADRQPKDGLRGLFGPGPKLMSLRYVEQT